MSAHMLFWKRLLVAVTAGTLLACGARTEYVVQHLEVERTSWDSLHVAVAFAKRAAIGGSSPIEAESTVATVFNSRYDTLYSGPAGLLPLPDPFLGDKERLMLEVCGAVKQREICVQETLRASPKRLHVLEQITYPRNGDVTEGSYDLTFGVERQRFDGDGWETVEAADVKGHLLAWIDDPEAKERGAVRIPFEKASGRFNLERQANYKNFKYYLESELLDHQSADVYFDIYAGLGEHKIRLASTKKEVRRKSDDERAREVRYFAEQAAERVIEELRSALGSGRAYAYIESWSFNAGARRYEIELEMEWEGSVFDRGRHEIEGALEVGENGSDARYRIRSGNRRAVRKWRDRTDERVLMLGDLGSYRDDYTATF